MVSSSSSSCSCDPNSSEPVPDDLLHHEDVGRRQWGKFWRRRRRRRSDQGFSRRGRRHRREDGGPTLIRGEAPSPGRDDRGPHGPGAQQRAEGGAGISHQESRRPDAWRGARAGRRGWDASVGLRREGVVNAPPGALQAPLEPLESLPEDGGHLLSRGRLMLPRPPVHDTTSRPKERGSGGGGYVWERGGITVAREERWKNSDESVSQVRIADCYSTCGSGRC